MNDLVPIGCWHRWHRKQVSCQLFPLYSILRAPGSGDRGDLCNTVCSKMISVSHIQRTHFQFIFFIFTKEFKSIKQVHQDLPIEFSYWLSLLLLPCNHLSISAALTSSLFARLSLAQCLTFPHPFFVWIHDFLLSLPLASSYFFCSYEQGSLCLSCFLGLPVTALSTPVILPLKKALVHLFAASLPATHPVMSYC